MDGTIAGLKEQIVGLKYWRDKYRRIIACKEHNHPVPIPPAVCFASDCPLCNQELRYRFRRERDEFKAEADLLREELLDHCPQQGH